MCFQKLPGFLQIGQVSSKSLLSLGSYHNIAHSSMTESTELIWVFSEDAPKVDVFSHMQQRYLDQKLDTVRGKQSDLANVGTFATV